MRSLSVWLGAIAALLSTTSGTASPPLTVDNCPTADGEFPFTDCAVVEGMAVAADGRILSGLPIRVDSFVPPIGYAYASGATATGADGRFELLVYRVNRLKALTVPDTASVEIKAYADPEPKPSSTPIDRALVVMWFSPLGAQVTHTIAKATFNE